MGKSNSALKARLILEREDGMILLLKQTTENGGKYTLVGGFVEKREFAKAGLIRESLEETGIDLREKNLELIHCLHKKRSKDSRIILYFKASKWKGEAISREPHKFKKVAWFPINDLPKNISSTVRHVLSKYSKGIRYSEYMG